ARQVLRHIAPGAEPDASFRPRTAMRITRHSASDAFFVHSLTVLRLTRAHVLAEPTPEMLELQRLLPPAERAMTPTDPTESLTGLTDQLRRAQERHDGPEIHAILQRIELVATRARNGSPLGPMEDVAEETDPAILWNAPDDVIKGVKESQALLETVHLRSARGVGESGGGPSAENLDEFDQLMAALGLSRLDVVADLPIVTASFGFTRRSVDPEHEEFQQRIATSLRPFPVLDDRASLTSGRHDLPGKHPILAREGEHEGLLLTLDLPRVVRWLALNGVDISQEQPARAAILAALEDVNRYYDNIWELPVRRLVFGLVHSLSHAAMRAASYFAGIDRTSISEYLFLPLLGTVVYSNATTFSLGGMEALARDHLSSFLVKLRSEAVSCLYDPDCLDRKSACHGCIHSPDISCRVFNHGLARSFLLGGRAPWASDAARVIGYWEI